MKTNKKPGPPPWIPTGDEIEKARALAARACTLSQIASVLKKSKSLIEKEVARNPVFRAAIEDGREFGVSSIKSKQYEMAMAGDKTMLIWWGKNYCDQKPDSENLIPPSDNPLARFLPPRSSRSPMPQSGRS